MYWNRNVLLFLPQVAKDGSHDKEWNNWIFDRKMEEKQLNKACEKKVKDNIHI